MISASAESAISLRLVRRGKKLLQGLPEKDHFTPNKQATRLIEDLNRTPHAFLIGCVVDRQIRFAKAWEVPLKLKRRIGSFRISELQALNPREFVRLMKESPSLHRYPEMMGLYIHSAVQRVAEQYGGDARRIWSGRPSSATVVYRFLEFQGVGPKIATMAATILARHFRIKFSDYYSIDISPDVHVRRVFRRLGLVDTAASVEEVIYRGRSHSPAFPGLLDLPTVRIGREWCRPRKPQCQSCYMEDVCPTAQGRGRRV